MAKKADAEQQQGDVDTDLASDTSLPVGHESQETVVTREPQEAATVPMVELAPERRILVGGGVHAELPGQFLGDGVFVIERHPNGSWHLL